MFILVGGRYRIEQCPRDEASADRARKPGAA
jgi:hypothetical protein